MRALDNAIRAVLTIWHRGAGKDIAAAAYMCKEAIRVRANYWHMFPFATQARAAFWEGISNDNQPILDMIYPPAIVAGKNSQEMRLTLVNGSVVHFLGSENYNRRVGSNPRGIIFSEWGVTEKPEAWTYLRPRLALNGGWAWFNSTPRGRNHLWEMYERYKGDPEWFVSMLTIDDTGLLDEASLDRERRENSRTKFLQEWYCSFDAPLEGGFLSSEISKALLDNRIHNPEHVRVAELPVETAWDIGLDTTAVWFFQRIGKDVLRFVDYHHAADQPLAFHVKHVLQRPYVFRAHWFPHDVVNREYQSGVSRVQAYRELGINPQMVPKQTFEASVETAKAAFARCQFVDSKEVTDGVETLKAWRKKPLPEHMWRKPGTPEYQEVEVHDWASHAGAAFRYACASYPPKRGGAFTPNTGVM